MFDKSSEKIRSMFNNIASNYDFLNNIISLFTHYFVKKSAIKALHIQKHSKVLDLCSGSGDLGRIIKNIYPQIEVIGVDFATAMLDIAKKRNPDIIYYLEDATNLSFKNETFDYVVMGFGLRNINNTQYALKEIHRVLKSDGYFLHLDFGVKNYATKIYDKLILLFINFFTKNTDAYKYLIDSKNKFLPPDKLIKLFESQGFQYITHKNLLFGIISYQIMKRI